ncbi:MAG TPA: hypothetical protein VE572_01975, partial [Nitrososphaeraceae archaeon]|nr:hypothetical protein [Nitrososphaeraceae archaeon]
MNPVSLALCSRRFWIHLNFQPHPTEPANKGSYTAASKEIIDIEIAMYQSAGTVIIIIIIDTSTIAAKTIVTAATQMLLLLIAACTF